MKYCYNSARHLLTSAIILILSSDFSSSKSNIYTSWITGWSLFILLSSYSSLGSNISGSLFYLNYYGASIEFLTQNKDVGMLAAGVHSDLFAI